MIVIPTFEKLRQEDKKGWKFRASLDLAKKDKDKDEKRKEEEEETEAGQEGVRKGKKDGGISL